MASEDQLNGTAITKRKLEQDKAHTFRKRRLSLNTTTSPVGSNYTARRHSVDSVASSNCSNDHVTRTLHSGELNGNNTVIEPSTKPCWRRRHTMDLATDLHRLPFDPTVVGTYSCQGMEPIYENDEDSDGVAVLAKINQDRGGIAFPYGNCPKTALFAVYDGHGQGGELISQYALSEVQRKLEKHPKFNENIHEALSDTFISVDTALKSEALIDPFFAGTTACVVLLRENKLYIANAGDSRVICARKEHGKYIALALSEDQNPHNRSELERITSMGGYVTQPPQPGLSSRVWLDEACTQIGLAMSRSIGDHAIATVGVIAEPVVTEFSITDQDEFLILASDGVWEFIENSEAIRIVSEHLDDATVACQKLIEAAAAKWASEEGDYRDDITAIVVNLRELWNSKPQAKSINGTS